MKYGIVGSGSANSKVIHEGLKDILKSDPEAVFVIHGRKSPQGSVGDVYDFLVDNECRIHLFSKVDDRVPAPLTDRAMVHEIHDDPLSATISVSDQILILWDDYNEDASNKIATRVVDGGKECFDLTMALMPVIVEGSGEVPAPVAPAKPVAKNLKGALVYYDNGALKMVSLDDETVAQLLSKN